MEFIPTLRKITFSYTLPKLVKPEERQRVNVEPPWKNQSIKKRGSNRCNRQRPQGNARMARLSRRQWVLLTLALLLVGGIPGARVSNRPRRRCR